MNNEASVTKNEAPAPAIEITDLHRSYGATEAVNGVNLTVRRGRCYGFFGRNGAGKTTTIKCLLNLLQPASGRVRVFGMDPAKDEVPVKSRLSWVPDTVAFYPWMRINGYFEYLASFRDRWNRQLESDLIEQFELDPDRKVTALSRGEKMQVALIGALCPEPELLVLDEPTSGLDPLVRREFIRTVIGAYQDGDPENRTVFVSTHLITEFEGLIDEFTIIDQGRDILAMKTEDARGEFSKLTAHFNGAGIPDLADVPCLYHRPEAGNAEIFTRGGADSTRQALQQLGATDITEESLSLEEIFLTTLNAHRSGSLTTNEHQ